MGGLVLVSWRIRPSFSVIRVGDPVGRTCCTSRMLSNCNFSGRGWSTTKKRMYGGRGIGSSCDGGGGGSTVDWLWRIYIFEPLYVLGIEKFAIWSNSAAWHCIGAIVTGESCPRQGEGHQESGVGSDWCKWCWQTQTDMTFKRIQVYHPTVSASARTISENEDDSKCTCTLTLCRTYEFLMEDQKTAMLLLSIDQEECMELEVMP